jgi:hypothetical protein
VKKKKMSPHAVSVDRRGFVYDLSQGFTSDARGKGRPGVTNATQNPAKTGITRDDWLSALKEADEASKPVTREPDVMSVREFAEMSGCAETTAKVKIRNLLAAGLVERVNIYLRRSNGTRFPSSGYRLLKKK